MRCHSTPPAKKRWTTGFPMVACACGVDFQWQTSNIGEWRSYGIVHNSKAQSGSYTNKKSRTFLDNGKRVTVQSVERDEIRLRQIYG
jgi:hypothetical protein